MGGSAFASDNLYTPRMPQAVYTATISRIESLLQPHFHHVGHPIEAPGKTSYGDIDVVVAEPRGGNAKIASEDFLAAVIGAIKWKRTSGSPTVQFVVEWPSESAYEAAGLEHEAASTPSTATSLGGHAHASKLPSASSKMVGAHETFIQVDIHMCPNMKDFHWHLFLHAHGDLWNFLGSIIRPYGLTCNHHGLFVRIAEVEPHNKDQARVKMTDDPQSVLDFLGLDPTPYWLPFDNADELMDYAIGCRFFDPGRWQIPDGGDSVKNQPDLKANDRQRLAKRPIFAYWITTYLPAHANCPPGSSACLSRDDVVADAKRFCGDGFAAEFDERKATMVRQIGIERLWADAKKLVRPGGIEKGYVMGGLKREICGDPAAVPDTDLNRAEQVREAYVAGRFDDVLDWATEHWEAVGERQKKIAQVNYRRMLMRKSGEGEEKDLA